MRPAVERIDAALKNGESILIHGDYDADGVTATALLARLLGKMGGQVHWYLPHRVRDGYGVSMAAIERAAAEGASLLITVDCGVSARRKIERAKELGVDTVIIDHHEVPPDPPDALLVDPKRPDAEYPFPDLASVGLVYKVGLALCRERGLSETSFQRAFLDLVAVGTIADVSPLVEENRALVRAGLALLPHTRKVGLSALLQLCQVGDEPEVTDIAFRVAPRLNAAGRMADAALALELMLTDDQAQAHRTSLRLDTLNRERQREQDRIATEALRVAERQVDLDNDLVLVLHAPGWHIGVLGIVAAKLVDMYARPAIVLVEEGEVARGSARSTAALHIADALAACSEVLQRHGGHALAAGLAVSSEQIPEFRRRINAVAAEMLGPEDLIPRIDIDGEIALAELTEEVLAQMDALRPFGEANPPPLFAARGVQVRESRTVGRDGRHLKLTVEQAGRSIDCIGFGLGGESRTADAGREIDVCFTPQMNEFNGRRSMQLKLEAVRRAEAR